jgi:hypothetical protein
MVSSTPIRPGLPNRPLKPYIALKRAKSVTIAVGIRCLNAIVLGSDSQVTWAGSHKTNESKFLSISSWNGINNWTVGFVYSGWPHAAKKLQQDLRDRLLPVPNTTVPDTTLDQVKEAILEFIPQDLSIIAVFSMQNAQSTLLVVHEGRIREADDIEYIGCADSSLMHYLADQVETSEPFGTDEAANIAAKLIGNAKRYIDGCGGPTILITIKNGLIVLWTESNIEILERQSGF